MTERTLPTGMTHEDLIVFMKTVEPGQVFQAASGNQYKTIRELTGHGWSWHCLRQDGKNFSVHVCDLAWMERIHD